MRNILMLAFILSLSMTVSAQSKLLNEVNKVLKGNDKGLDIGGGLKAALDEGTKEAVNVLSAENGYLDSPFKVLIPEEAQQIISKLSKVPGFRNIEKDLVTKMNEAASFAAKEASPIFFNSIKQITFKDATNILMGDKDAATQYLESTSRVQLYETFLPIIQRSLDEVGAREYWTKAITTYNKLPFVKKTNPELDDHVNNRALDGLFGYIAIKEEGIRNDIGQRSSPLLQEVFQKQDNRN